MEQITINNIDRFTESEIFQFLTNSLTNFFSEGTLKDRDLYIEILNYDIKYIDIFKTFIKQSIYGYNKIINRDLLEFKIIGKLGDLNKIDRLMKILKKCNNNVRYYIINDLYKSILNGSSIYDIEPDVILAEFKNDKDERIRETIASYGLYLHKYYKDPSYRVRYEVAKQGKYLDILVFDEHEMVRAEVARQGKYLELLMDDESSLVLSFVAKHEKYRNLFKSHPNYLVRRSIASEGYFLDEYAVDSHHYVRLEVVKQGYITDTFKYECNLEVIKELISRDYIVKEFLNRSVEIDKIIANKGKFLDILYKSKYKEVRKIVASKGEYHDDLIYDKDIEVIKEVVKITDNINYLISLKYRDDEKYFDVLVEIINRGLMLNFFKNHKNEKLQKLAKEKIKEVLKQ